MMGKTQKGHCERSIGSNVPVPAINQKTFEPLKTDVNKNFVIVRVPKHCRYGTSPETFPETEL